ncbi:MAG: thioredoxin family protein [Planctomycetes bacterium]|nr:thioredoxin family protein [Planctomycetota bacterium]
MNRFNFLLNAVVVLLTVGAGGYLAYESGFGFGPIRATPDDPWFRATVLESKQPVIVKFGADWCPPCRMLEPELDRLASSGQVAVVKIDVGRNHALARHYRVSSIPDVYLFHNGAAVAHRVGFVDHDQLRKWIDRQLAK